MAKLFQGIATGMLIAALGFPTTVFAEEISIPAEETLLEVEEPQEGQDGFDNLEEADKGAAESGGQDAGNQDTGDQDAGDQDAGDQDAETPRQPEWKKGWNEYEGNWYYCKNDAELHFGWVKLKSKWYYLDGSDAEHPGIMARDELKEIEGKYYAFDANGAMQTGWVKREEGWYYADHSGALCSGWVKVKGKWYYLDPENAEHPLLMKSGEMAVIKEKRYSFSGSGAMQTGWVKREEGWYYADHSGALCSGWVKVKGKWYYLDPNHAEHPLLMKSNEIKGMLDNKYYAFDINGAMRIGWIKNEEGWYYANNDGSFASGWVKVKGKWYYLDPENAEYPLLMKSSEIAIIEGERYSFDGNGAMHIGWIKSEEGWYYANNKGALVTGWVKVKGKWYYLEPEGSEHPYLMLANTTCEIDGKTYTFEASGAMKAGWEAIDGNWYYRDVNSGQIVTGWKYINGYWYYFYNTEDSYGQMAKNTVIEGKYVVHGNGAYIRSRNKLGWQNPGNYPQVSSMSVALPSYCTGYFTYVTPSRISIYASKQDCIDAFIARAYEYLGTQYIEPWSSWPGDAVDCSGLVLQCLYATGMDLGVYNPYNHRWMPSQTYNSMNWYRNNTFMPVSVNSIQRGDLVYYRGHVAIYLGNGQIIDSWPGQGVSVRPIGSRGAVIGAARPFV